jgi:hypothetical protein
MTRRALAIAALAMTATAVHGHELIPGVTGLPGAALHPLAAADQLMALVAAGLLAGSGGWRGWLWGLAGLVAGFAAGFANLIYGPDIPFAWLGALVVALLAALATALNLRPHPAIAGLFSTIAGIVIANDALPEADTWAAIATTGAGTLLGIAIIQGVPGAISAMVKAGWLRVLVRVVASWIAASAIMVLAFALAPLLRG